MVIVGVDVVNVVVSSSVVAVEVSSGEVVVVCLDVVDVVAG